MKFFGAMLLKICLFKIKVLVLIKKDAPSPGDITIPCKKHHGHRRRQKISRGEQRKSAFYFLTQGYVKIKIVKLFLDFSVFFLPK